MDDPLPGRRWALGDGRVSETEYRTAMNRFISCVRNAGYATTTPVLSPADNLTLVHDITPDGDPDTYNEAVQTCNLADFAASAGDETAVVDGVTSQRARVSPKLPAFMPLRF
ncbi:hypothetical protein IAG44_29175 [Streptomyces roseirectus]|uniref:Uncharacterized protein n=1 Tax=Streptomyces roseirectus TaxID=2768066 RepID=A0A7H0IJY9_9ACTN|nr:hypothetical protein [Streptomyces roseirectus]QNP73105.1 hypothetical protein IAG44_29175 [Streptomyces roseirectus]